MTNPSGPIAIICGYDANGVVRPALIDADGALVVAGGSTSVDAQDVTYSPADASDWNSGVDPGNQNQANDQLADRTKALETLLPYTPYPKRASFWCDELTALIGNAWTPNLDATQPYGWYTDRSPRNDLDSATHSIALVAGTYTLSLLGATGPNCALLDVQGKHTSEGSYANLTTSIDWYSAGSVVNVIKTASVTIAKSGIYAIKLLNNGKNGSSGGYAMFLTKVWFKQATD